MFNKHSLSDIEIIIKGIQILQKSLGSAATRRFLSLIHGGTTDYDYVKISQKLYQDQSIDKIYNRVKQNWKY